MGPTDSMIQCENEVPRVSTLYSMPNKGNDGVFLKINLNLGIFKLNSHM